MPETSLPRWVLVVALGALVIIPTGLALRGKDASVIWPVALACMAAVLLIRLPDVELFKAGPLEARLRRATEKAEATVEQLQQLGVKLAGPILGTMAAAGRWDSATPRKESVETYDQITKMLKDMGASNVDVQAVSERYNEYLSLDLFYDLRLIVTNENRGKANDKVADKCVSFGDAAPIVPPASVIRSCLESASAVTTEVNEALLDLEQFQRDRTLRRRSVFIGRTRN